jgi:DNA repair exonuclease SbcCD ATPase subunit
MKKIKSIEVKNSSFFNDIRIEFTKGLNCIMGGRGTGKTTLLYFIKAAIEANAESISDVYKILQSNLGDGSINLELEGEDAVTYRITKAIGDAPQSYILPGQVYVPIDKITKEIECDIYEAGRIEEIGRSSKDRLALLDKKIKNEISEQGTAIEKLQIDLDANAQDIKTFNKRLSQIDDILVQYQNVDEEFNAHKNQQPAGIKEDEKKEFETADSKEKIRKDEKRFYNKTIEKFSELQNDIEFKKNDLLDYRSKANAEKDNFDNKDLIDESFSLAETTIKKIVAAIEELSTEINSSKSKLGGFFGKLIEKHDLQQADFIKLKQKFDLNKEYINKYHSLSKKADEKRNLVRDKEELLLKQERLKEQRKSLIEKLNRTKQEIFNIRLKAVKELNDSFNKDIVITLTFGGITDEYEERLRNALRGSGMRYNELIPRIVTNFSTDQFASIVNARDMATLKNITGIDEARATALIESFYETESIYEIESMYCSDLPEFKLKIADDATNKEENYRKTDELSMGQRCTTVLPIIFAVSNNPLIIDQPEDNLDNKYITNRIHEIVRKQKENRQLIFITHNPNIPVLSDAEKNVFLIYEARKSRIEGEGNVTEVKDKIVSLLEGGAEAFKKRVQIYGL